MNLKHDIIEKNENYPIPQHLSRRVLVHYEIISSSMWGNEKEVGGNPAFSIPA
jgi:hypothetical protein